MNREVHVRNCEGVGVKLPRATRLRYSERSFSGPRSFGHCNPLLHFHSQFACLNNRGHSTLRLRLV